MCFCPSLCWDHSVSNNSRKFFACRNYIMSCCTSCGQRHLLYNVISQDTEKMYFSDFLWVWTQKIKWWQFVFYAMTRHGLCLCQQDDCKTDEIAVKGSNFILLRLKWPYFWKTREQPGPSGNMFDTPGLKENIIHGKSQAWNDKEVNCNFTDWWKQKV